MRLFTIPFSSLALVALLAGCAAHEGTTSGPDTEVRTQLRASIASVQLIQDCPDREPAQAPAPAADEPAAAARIAPGPGGTFEPPCTQSTMQLSLGHDAAEAQRIEIVEVRLLVAGKSETVGTLPARKPSKWNDSGVYDAWDERIPVGSDIKVSYRLGEPDWAKVQEKLGGVDPYGQRFQLEVDLKVGGKTTTIRSPEFAREYPHVVVT